ncbi:unnamed protein product [Fusarium fujikuroi]|nr:unnamed protein product [Fusarium fujikuroi]
MRKTTPSHMFLRRSPVLLDWRIQMKVPERLPMERLKWRDGTEWMDHVMFFEWDGLKKFDSKKD